MHLISNIIKHCFHVWTEAPVLCTRYLHFSKYFEQFKLLTRAEVKHYIVVGHQRTLEQARNHCAAKYCRCRDSKHWEQTIVFSLKKAKTGWRTVRFGKQYPHQKWTKNFKNSDTENGPKQDISIIVFSICWSSLMVPFFLLLKTSWFALLNIIKQSNKRLVNNILNILAEKLLPQFYHQHFDEYTKFDEALTVLYIVSEQSSVKMWICAQR